MGGEAAVASAGRGRSVGALGPRPGAILGAGGAGRSKGSKCHP